MEYHFGIKYEFDISTIHKRIDEQVNSGLPTYICAPDGNVINMVHHSGEYRDVVNGSMFSICDSGWAPIFIKWVHGKRYVFGFYSNLPDVPGRSPRWLQRCHLEFVHRLFTEPKKQIKRCWSIIVTLPKILYNEYKAKKTNITP